MNILPVDAQHVGFFQVHGGLLFKNEIDAWKH